MMMLTIHIPCMSISLIGRSISRLRIVMLITSSEFKIFYNCFRACTVQFYTDWYADHKLFIIVLHLPLFSGPL